MSEITVLSTCWMGSNPGDSRIAENFPDFRIGEILRGKVLYPIGSQHAFLQLGTQRLLVETRIPLPPQLELQFRVEEIQPRVILKLIPAEMLEDPKVHSLLKNYLPLDIPLKNLSEKIAHLAQMGSGGIPPSVKEPWKEFLTLLYRFSPSDLFSSPPGSLGEWLSQTGFFWENKIGNWAEAGKKDSLGLLQGDLKGLAMKVLDHLKDSSGPMGRVGEDGPFIHELKGILESFIQKIELYQILNLGHGPEKVFFFLPLWWGGNLQFVELNFSFPQERSSPGDARELSLLFLLTLPDLGKIRIEVRVKEMELFCRFLVADPRSSEFLLPLLPSLRGRLEKLGYQSHIQLSVVRPEKLEAPLIQDPDLGPKSLFSITV